MTSSPVLAILKLQHEKVRISVTNVQNFLICVNGQRCLAGKQSMSLGYAPRQTLFTNMALHLVHIDTLIKPLLT